MAYPQFSKTGMTTLVLNKGYIFPFAPYEEVDQVVNVSQGQKVRVGTLSPPVRFIPFRCEGLYLEDYLGIHAWLHHPNIRFQEGLFNFTDTDADTKEVRWWGGRLEMPQTTSGLFAINITLRVEAVAW